MRRLPTFALVVATALAATLGCRTPARSSRAPSCSPDSTATLRVSNSSGRVLEIHAWSPEGNDRVLGSASPGTSTFEVDGPAALGMRYGALDPSAGRFRVIVTWLRPHGRAGAGVVMLDLVCGAP